MRVVIDVTCDVFDAEDIPTLPCYLEHELEYLGPPEGVVPDDWYAEVVEGRWRYHTCV